MIKQKEYTTNSGLSYFSPRREINEMRPWNMEYTAFLRQLYLDSNAKLGEFLPNMDETAYDYTTGRSENHYAYALYTCLHTLGNEANLVAPIYDAGRSHWNSLYDSPFRASAEFAVSMSLPYSSEDREKIYPTLVKKIEEHRSGKITLKAVSSYFESDKENRAGRSMVDWLYSTLYFALSNEVLMTDIEYGARKKVTLKSIYDGMATIVREGPDRSRSEGRKSVVLDNLTENAYFLSRPKTLRTTGEKPVLIDRQ